MLIFLIHLINYTKMKPKARVIAMYLPQFHPIPENDDVWGKGYTEWINVAQAKPLFKGHIQPRIPADLGFYDLRVPEVREEHAQLAKDGGLEGFMYWHYWFGNGKRLLERPFDEVLMSGKPDFPFCLGWANHHWKTSTWTTLKNFRKDGMICEQTYPGDEDYIAHFNYCLKAFKDHRYIKVDGKPFFLVYNAKDIPDCKHFFDLWNKLARENGFPGMHFVGLSDSWENAIDGEFKLGYNAVAHSGKWVAETKAKGKYTKLIEHKIRRKLDIVPLDKYDYQKLYKDLITERDKEEFIYPCIIPGWDRSPRSGRRAVIWYNNTPEYWKKHVQMAVDAVQNKEDEHKIIILRSWNEWGEGNFVEPDKLWGHAFLDSLKEVLFGKD